MTKRETLLARLAVAQDNQTNRDITTIVYCKPGMTDAQLEAHVEWYERKKA